MKLSNFNLSSDNKTTVFFPIPHTNQYQKISNLDIGQKAKIIDLGNNNKIAVFPVRSFDIYFKHLPLAINKNIENSNIVQVKKNKLPKPDLYMNYEDNKMKKIANSWIKLHKVDTPNMILKVFYYETLKFLTYGNPIRGIYSYQDALFKRVTDCGGFSTFLGTLLLTQGIPCKLVVGYLYKLGKSYALKRALNLSQGFESISMHAWLEVLEDDGSWFPVDPSIEWERINNKNERLGGFGIIPADRLVLSYGQNHKFKYKSKNYQFPILQHLEKA